MKPTPQISSNQPSKRRGETARRDHRGFPLTDYDFQATSGAVGTSIDIATKGMAESRTFRKVSRDFFAAEATREYVVEAMFFAGIYAFAAWPIAVMIYQLTTMMISPDLLSWR